MPQLYVINLLSHSSCMKVLQAAKDLRETLIGDHKMRFLITRNYG